MKSLNELNSIICSLAISILFFGCQKIYAQAGALDPSFGVGGKVNIDFSNDRDEAFVVKVQKDQKLIIAGLSRNFGNNDFALTRLHPDGSIDHY